MQATFDQLGHSVVFPIGCQSCEDKHLQQQRKQEDEDRIRLGNISVSDKMGLLTDVWQYGQTLTAVGGVMLKPDNEVRRYLVQSVSELSPLMAKIYKSTMNRVPYETSWAICAPEQATALRTLASMVRPRDCLDIGSFTGLSSAAVLDALPVDAKVTFLEINSNLSEFAAENLKERNVEEIRGNATDSLRTLEENGRQYDFVVIDADYTMHESYFNASIRLLRPGGVIVLFGMLFAQGVEGLRSLFPADERIQTVMLPLGCGLQVSVKTEGLDEKRPLADSQRSKRKKWQLDSEIAAIDRYLAQLDHPVNLKTELIEGAKMADPTPLTYIALGRQQGELVKQAEAANADALQARLEARVDKLMRFGVRLVRLMILVKACRAIARFIVG